MRGYRAVYRDDRPAVGECSDIGATKIEHWLYGQNEPDFQWHSTARDPVIGHLRLLVRFTADSMADEITNDSIAGFLGRRLNRSTDIAEPVAWPCLLDTQLKRV